jgi:ATP-dependent Clp protease adaptor protein ClpS
MSTDTKIVEVIQEDVKVEEPKMYMVLLHNDDFTTFDFVIAVLTEIFHKTVDEAFSITESIHHTGKGIAGCPYTKEIAEEKVYETIQFAQANGYPLIASLENM